MEIREWKAEDADRFVDLFRQFGRKSDWFDIERLKRWVKKSNAVLFIAAEEDRFVGFISAIGGDDEASRGTAQVCVGVLPSCTGKGIGTKLFETLEQWALDNHIHRLELAVMQRDRSLLMLCNKVGFSVEGMKKESLSIEDRYVNEYYLARLMLT